MRCIGIVACEQEEYYLEHNVAKAQRIDEWTAEVLTTSVVDDTFFILQKCGIRALATGNLQCVCAILGHVNSLLASHLRAALEHKWKVRCPCCLMRWRGWNLSLRADSCCAVSISE